MSKLLENEMNPNVPLMFYLAGSRSKGPLSLPKNE